MILRFKKPLREIRAVKVRDIMYYDAPGLKMYLPHSVSDKIETELEGFFRPCTPKLFLRYAINRSSFYEKLTIFFSLYKGEEEAMQYTNFLKDETVVLEFEWIDIEEEKKTFRGISGIFLAMVPDTDALIIKKIPHSFDIRYCSLQIELSSKNRWRSFLIGPKYVEIDNFRPALFKSGLPFFQKYLQDMDQKIVQEVRNLKVVEER